MLPRLIARPRCFRPTPSTPAFCAVRASDCVSAVKKPASTIPTLQRSAYRRSDPAFAPCVAKLLRAIARGSGRDPPSGNPRSDRACWAPRALFLACMIKSGPLPFRMERRPRALSPSLIRHLRLWITALDLLTYGHVLRPHGSITPASRARRDEGSRQVAWSFAVVEPRPSVDLIRGRLVQFTSSASFWYLTTRRFRNTRLASHRPSHPALCRAGA